MYIDPFTLFGARPVTASELSRLGLQSMTVKDLIYEIDPIPFFDGWDEGTIEI